MKMLKAEVIEKAIQMFKDDLNGNIFQNDWIANKTVQKDYVEWSFKESLRLAIENSDKTN